MMLHEITRLLSKGSSLLFLVCLFIVTQSWIASTLGESTSHKVLNLQTFCLHTPYSTSLSDWTEDDIDRFQRHFLIDGWFHPLVYGFALASAILYDAKRRSKSPRSHLVVAIAFLGATCDVVENHLHQSLIRPPNLLLDDKHVLYGACVFASTKWFLTAIVVSFIVRRFVFLPPPPSRTIFAPKVAKGWHGPQGGDIANAKCDEIGLLAVQGHQIPFTVCQPDYTDSERSYIVSVYAHYIGYAYDELKFYVKNRFARLVATAGLRMVSVVARTLALDEAVLFNNRLSSTCLWPSDIEWSLSEVNSINRQFQSSNPKKAIVWRSIDVLSQPALAKTLQKSNCLLVPARIICWQQDPIKSIQYAKSKQIRRDMRLFRELVGWDVQKQTVSSSDEVPLLEMSQISPNELTLETCEQFVDLYNQLYLSKYSLRNPQLTPDGLLRMFRSGYLHPPQVLFETNSKVMVAWCAGHSVDKTITFPYVGYTVGSENQHLALYRLINVMTWNQILRDQIPNNHMSGGVSDFKQLRRGMATLEYIAVFVDHLPLHRRFVWGLLNVIADRVITLKRSRK